MSAENQVLAEDLVETEPRAKVTGKFINGSSTGPVCRQCNKRVYEMEKIVADQYTYHKTCFRCTHCNRVLSLGSYATGGGKPYCKPHFISLFKVKGNYEEGFSMTSEALISQDEVDKSSGTCDKNVHGEGAECEEERPRFITMASAKSVFERAAASDTSLKAAKKTSKWDKPKPMPPPAVNRDSENTDESAESELPPPAYTKNMLAKFQSLQQSDGQLTKEFQASKPKKLWEDETEMVTDKREYTEDADNCVTTNGAGDDTSAVANVHSAAAENVEGDVESSDNVQESSCMLSGAEDCYEQEVTDGKAAETDCQQEDCLISFDDVGSGMQTDPVVNKPDAQMDVGNDVNCSEDDVPSHFPSQDVADENMLESDDHIRVHECNTGEV